MIRKTVRSAALAVSLLAFTAGLSAQAPKVEFPAASPASTLKQRVGLTDIEIVYARPGVKGRTIFGGIEAYGRVWRTGANSATRISFSTPVKFGGADLAAGSYLLFSIPGANEWTVILQKDAKAWGAYQYDPANDVARVTAKPVALAAPVETFTIDLNDLRNESATLNLIWENTRVPVPLTVDVASTLVPQIEAAAASGEKLTPGFYYNAAMFYFDKGLDLNKAKAWIEQATSGAKPAFYMVHLKAKILAKRGEKEAAIAAAKQSSELATAAEGPQSPFLKMNRDLIESLN
ncbi:MAG TPA: DUF2911 domain-containing protein [Opitutaceae bacterium]